MGRPMSWKLIPDRAGYAEVALTWLGQKVIIGTLDCAMPNEHTCVSRTQALVQVIGRAHEDRNTSPRSHGSRRLHLHMLCLAKSRSQHNDTCTWRCRTRLRSIRKMGWK